MGGLPFVGKYKRSLVRPARARRVATWRSAEYKWEQRLQHRLKDESEYEYYTKWEDYPSSENTREALFVRPVPSVDVCRNWAFSGVQMGAAAATPTER
ncbi:unnamed protein product, partial [Mesorhabditis spiculigera]